MLAGSDNVNTTEKRKRLRQKLKMKDLPDSYQRNSVKEEAVLEFVEHFRRQFVQLFPDRCELPLAFWNECGVPKFVCTTIRPTALPFPEIYDLQPCAAFVSSFLNYLPLKNPTQLPHILPASEALVHLREGDCLDFAVFLCSVLRGASYDAFVVVGTAPRFITAHDTTGQPFTREAALSAGVEDEEAPTEVKEKKEDEEAVPCNCRVGCDGVQGGDEKKYQVSTPAKYKSTFLKQQREKKSKRKTNLDEARLNAALTPSSSVEPVEVKEEEEEEEKEKLVDAYEGKRVHAWVLVRAGRRDVTRHLFIEPSSGTVLAPAESAYLSVTCVMNDRNLWVNMQSTSVQSMAFDLKDVQCWDAVMVAREPKAEGDEEVAEENEKEEPIVLDAPLSWARPVAIPRDMFRRRFPVGKRTTSFADCVVEQFVPWTEETGLVARATLYKNKRVMSTVEVFANREDLLRRRVTTPSHTEAGDAVKLGTVRSIYSPGRVNGLSEVVEMAGEKIIYHFYPTARTDGLVLGVKVVETFANRDDHLTYRSVCVDAEVQMYGTRRRFKGFSVNLGGRGLCPISKITEKFSRNPAVEENLDVRKRTHLIAQGKVCQDYHYLPHAIVALQDTFDKTEETCVITRRLAESADTKADTVLMRRYTPAEVQRRLQKVLHLEKALMGAVKDRERNMQEIVTALDKERESVRLVKGIYLKEQERSDRAGGLERDEALPAGEASVVQPKRGDFLAPFLSQFPSNKPLTRKQALQAKDACLDSLKERLLERANIIQAHLTKENEQLRQRRGAFQRLQNQAEVQGEAGPSEKEKAEFKALEDEVLFRISILQARLARHEEVSLQKYAEMDRQLRTDPRLRSLV